MLEVCGVLCNHYCLLSVVRMELEKGEGIGYRTQGLNDIDMKHDSGSCRQFGITVLFFNLFHFSTHLGLQ